MCGLAGVVGEGARDAVLLARMAGEIAHRGPDDEGFWSDAEAGVAFAHRRLAIIDLSPAGHQPMASDDGRWVLAYNGEIYNHAELRAELEAAGLHARPWRGHSDTETLAECVSAWGLEETLQKSVGMFALALWDRRDRVLRLARDRFGEKPLYFGWVGGDFAFGSELKSLRRHPRFANEIDRRALRLLAARTYIPAPLSIYRDVYKLEPGCILSASSDALRRAPPGPLALDVRRDGLELRRYWSYAETVANGLADPITDEAEALQQLEQALATAIAGQSIADVPVGAFLSGGIDSSTVVALYRKYSPGTVRTFTIGFEEAAFNEADYARAVAAHLGTEHHERTVTVREAQDVIPLLPRMYDEPFADSSQIPTHLVSRFAREHVTVTLSGDGGDELFGGYNRYVGAARLWGQLKRLPAPLRAMAGKSFGGLPPAAWNRMAAILPGGPRQPHFGTKVQKALRTMGRASSLEDVFATFLDEWSAERSPVLGGEDVPSSCVFDLEPGAPAPDAIRMMYCDARSYLPDDILCKVDRASMAVSLESRVPFLDHRVAELAARIPLDLKIRNGKGKHILRKLLHREVPERLFERPKTGFGIPVGEWLKGPLRPWAEELLDGRRLETDGWFDAERVRSRWQQHLSGVRDSTPALWAILMFQAWAQENLSHGAEPARLSA
jgi:asparagine synthase (glutamine-hydrolysing)